jgi:hypothetical protein
VIAAFGLALLLSALHAAALFLAFAIGGRK